MPSVSNKAKSRIDFIGCEDGASVGMALQKRKRLILGRAPGGVFLALEKRSPRNLISVLAMQTGPPFLNLVPGHGRICRGDVARNGGIRLLFAPSGRLGLFGRHRRVLRSFIARNRRVRVLVLSCHKPSVPKRPANCNADVVKLARPG